jgi:Outer membrane lipoprotein carrier protein LolA-like
MTAGSARAAARALAVLALAGCPAQVSAAAATSDGWGIEELMHALGQVKSSKARFVERKHMAILSVPLELSGTLAYAAPGRLEKHTLSPHRESMVLEGDRLTLDDGQGNRRRTVRLQDYPLVRAFVESIRSTLAGDLATLNQFYEVGLEGGERQWRLKLKPREPDMQGVVNEIRISGSRDWVSRIEIDEIGGDRSIMTVTRDGN